MAPSLNDYNFESVYEASKNDLVREFYLPALKRANSYDRAAGYFRSSVFHLAQVAMSDFALRTGAMRLICSPSLDNEDSKAIRRSTVLASAAERSITSDIRAALQDPMTLPVVEFMSTLIRVGTLDIRVAVATNMSGIFHSKVGIIGDEVGNFISFEGSPNETYMAWTHNEERFKAFRSWIGGDLQHIRSDQDYFEDLWNSRRESVDVRPLPEVAHELLRQHSQQDPQAAVERVRSLADVSQSELRRQPKKLQPHQLAVLENWRTERRGIIDHVTGGGKTISAIACIRDWFRTELEGTALVVVPTDLLTLQWAHELRAELGSMYDLSILHVGGSKSDPNWRDRLRDFVTAARRRRRMVVVATMDSAASSDFVNRISGSDMLMVVVDEVHKIGSTRRCNLLQADVRARLGLSATPHRYRDPSGTKQILDYFGPVLTPSFSIRDAQDSIPPRLVPYSYNVHLVGLTESETLKYQDFGRRIAISARKFAESAATNDEAQLKNLFISRSRVLKNAIQKIPEAVQLLSDRYGEGERWLVYCDTSAQLNDLANQLRLAGLATTKYLSDMESPKPETLERFESIGGILLSVRCLDEGIDIPRVSHALILASSVNPREHIQRRGRVLRTSPGKARATIHDTLVGMEDEDGDLRVLNSEVGRARSFATDAINSREICWYLDSLTLGKGDGSSDFEDEE